MTTYLPETNPAATRRATSELVSRYFEARRAEHRTAKARGLAESRLAGACDIFYCLAGVPTPAFVMLTLIEGDQGSDYPPGPLDVSSTDPQQLRDWREGLINFVIACCEEYRA